MSFRIVILAGGKGTRMKIDRPKVLVELSGRPLIGHIFDNLQELFLLKPIVVVGFQGEKVVEFLKDKADFAWQKEQLGTGHALLCAKEKFANFTGTIVVLYGDQPLISSATINKLLQVHRENNAQLTLLTVHVKDFVDWRQAFFNYGRILRNENGCLSGICEIKEANEQQKNILEVNPGIYCFDSAWLWRNIEKIKNENSQKEFYLTDILKIALESSAKVASATLPDREALGANTPGELRVLERRIKNVKLIINN